jgi:carboxypeptidase family protein
MKQRSITLLATAALLVLAAFVPATVFAQGGATSSLSGTVTDASGAVLPGADVKVKNNNTGAEFTAVTADNGTFTIPSLNAGTYTVTVTMMNFKTVVLSEVVLNAGVPASVKAQMEIGNLEDTIVVKGGTEIIQTQSATVSTTMNVGQIARLPMTSRNALDFVVNLPGTNTPGGSRDSTINGLPQSAINITLDGMNIQDNYLKTTDGFFARLSPRLDAVEEVTLTTAANGADSAGQGAVQIRFTTRSGSNKLSGSSYLYLRHDALNANSWFNNRNLAPPGGGKAPKNELRQYQPGTRVGGPIVIPGLYDGHDKAFFFVNYEETRSPSKGTLNRTILTSEAQAGIFRYTVSGEVRTKNLYELAGQFGHLNTPDPLVGKLLNDIRASTNGTGNIEALTDPNLQRFSWQTPLASYTPAPTVRVDYNLSSKHRLTGSFNYQHINSDPDTTNSQQRSFPGFPIYGSQQSTRYTTSEAIRSTLNANMVNEFRGGVTGGATYFSPEKTANGAWWDAGQPIANQGGFHLGISAAGITNAGVTPTPSVREASTKNFEDTFTWIRGTHSYSFGGAFTQADLWYDQQTLRPTINFGVPTGDPADAMFVSGNFSGASTTQINAARALYSVLTGRISSIGGNARFEDKTGEFRYLGRSHELARLRETGFFAQDTWRMRPNLTMSYGLRYELQFPFYPLTDAYSTATLDDVCGISGVASGGGCNIFQPNVRTGQRPTFDPFPAGTHAYNTDYNNFAPSIGLTWSPGKRGGVLGRILGEEGDTVLRGGYALAYERHGMVDFRDVYTTNPGVSISANRDTATGTLLQDGGTFPVLLRETSRLGPPNNIPKNLAYPYADVITGDLDIFDPNLQVPYSQTWTASLGRKITRDIGIDLRYVGTRHLQDWIDYNFNESNIVENGFLNEFKLAMANLQSHIASGCGGTNQPSCSFAYRGPGTGTSPLPIYLAYLNGSADVNNSAAYSGSAWTSSNWVNPLAAKSPNPFTPAGTGSSTGLDGDATRRANAAKVGLAPNFFRANPDLQGGVFLTGNGGYTRYDSFQMEVRKRLSHGFQIDGSYVYGNSWESSRYSLRKPRYKTLQTGTIGGVTHAFKSNWLLELPFGRGRKWFGNAGGLVDRIVGGWELNGIARIQTGRLLDFGNVRLVGMSADELRKSLKIQDYAPTGISATAPVARYLMPQDIVENTWRAFNTSATHPTGYANGNVPTGRYLAPANDANCIEIAPGSGDCGVRTLVITGPLYQRIDLAAVKRVKLVGRTDFEFRAEMLNAFNHPNFAPVIGATSTADDYRITGVQENSSRIVQLVFRLNW